MSNIKELFKILPIFETVKGKVFFKDKDISTEELHIDFVVEDVIVVLPLVYKKSYENGIQVKFTFRLEYRMDLKEGWIIIKNDYILPDESCMKLYSRNIDVLSFLRVDNKNLYDRTAIERRLIIKNIIEHE